VGVEAFLRVGVLLLPQVAGLLVTREPLPRRRVEALGVDVLAGSVVGGGHAVLRGVEGGVSTAAALVGLLQRQADAAALEVDVDDLDEQLVTDVDDLLRDLHVTLRQLGDVDQPLDPLVHANE